MVLISEESKPQNIVDLNILQVVDKNTIVCVEYNSCKMLSEQFPSQFLLEIAF